MSNNTLMISPIAIDMGAKYTGVWSGHYVVGTMPEDWHITGSLIHAPDGKAQWSQRNRTQKRHQSRGFKRRRLGKRLMHLILREVYGRNLSALPKDQQEFLNGLFNRRGFTYLSEELDEELLNSADRELVAELLPGFNADSDLPSQVNKILQDFSRCEALLKQSPYSLTGKDWNKKQTDWLSSQSVTDRNTQKNLKALIKEIREAFEKSVNAGKHGYHPRHDYLDHIRFDLKNIPTGQALCQSLGLTPDALANLVGHISNLQLRVLRRYFSDKKMQGGKDYWDEVRMAAVFWRWIKAWRPGGDHDKAAARTALLGLQGQPLLTVWVEQDPRLSIPPYEDQNNRRPPKCRSLLLDIDVLQRDFPQWRLCVQRLERAHTDMVSKLDAITGHDKHSPKSGGLDKGVLRDARLLQRVLDRNSSHDPYKLRMLSRRNLQEHLSHEFQNALDDLRRILDPHTDAFLSFACRYYEESREARSGYWEYSNNSRLLRVCSTTPPHKNKQLEILTAGILGIEPERIERAAFSTYLRDARIGRKTLAGILHDCAEAQKKYGSALKALWEQSVSERSRGGKLSNPEIIELFDRSANAARMIGQHLGQDEAQWERYKTPFSLAQIHNLLDDVHGFSSTCRACSVENHWRTSELQPGIAWAARLPADTVRPFDGVLARLIEAQAVRIARLKADQIRCSGENGARMHIPILLEQNFFEFAANLAEIKNAIKKKRDKLHGQAEKEREAWKSKDQRIKDASQGICPYNGAVLGNDGQVDHIVPQSLTHDWYGTSYNSEPNLIYCSIQGNDDKDEGEYSLENLHNRYLEAQFGHHDRRRITEELEKSLQPYLTGGRNKINFAELGSDDQRNLRHALFVPQLRRKLLPLLAQQNKSRVNGTQGWLARRISFHLRRELAGSDMEHFTLSVHRVQPEAVSAMRRILAKHEPIFGKKEQQPAASHVVDAAMVLATGLAEPAIARMLQTQHLTGEEGDASCLARLVPADIPIATLEAKAKYNKTKPWGQALFKDTYYGERFLPLLIDAKGLHAGFGPGNCIPFSVKLRKGIQADATALVLELLAPFLRYCGKNVCADADYWRGELARSKKPYLYFTVDKAAAFDHLWRVAKQNVNERERGQAELLAALRYSTVKKKVKEELENGNKPSEIREKYLADKLFTIKGKLTLKLYGGVTLKLGDDKMCAVTLPVRAAWESLLDDEMVRPLLGSKFPPEFDWDTLYQRHFPQQQSGRSHKGVRKEFSLPTLPEGGKGDFRLRRNDPQGNAVWQLATVEDTYNRGFARDGQGQVDFKAPVALNLFGKSSAVVPIDANETSQVRSVCPFDEWRSVEYPPALQGRFEELHYAPGSKDRFNVRVVMTWEQFQQINALAGNGWSSANDLPAEIKLDDGQKKEFQRTFDKLLGKPRSNLFLQQIGTNVVFWYIADGTSRGMRRLYQSGTVL